MKEQLKRLVICLAVFVVLYCAYRLLMGIIGLFYHVTAGILSSLVLVAIIIVAILIGSKISSR